MEQVKRQRDRRLRRRLLDVLHAARGGPSSGFISGTMLRDLYGDQSMARERCESDEHLMQLMRDLTNKGLVEGKDTRVYKREPWGLDVLEYRITATGSSLINETVTPDPDIDDARIGPTGASGQTIQ